MTDPRITPEIREKLATVDFGLQVQAFLKTKIGTYLVERASREVAQKTEVLKTMDIMAAPQAALRVQSEIWRAETFMYWLGDAIREGAQLMEQMLAEERQQMGLDEAGDSGGDATGN